MNTSETSDEESNFLDKSDNEMIITDLNEKLIKIKSIIFKEDFKDIQDINNFLGNNYNITYNTSFSNSTNYTNNTNTANEKGKYINKTELIELNAEFDELLILNSKYINNYTS